MPMKNSNMLVMETGISSSHEDFDVWATLVSGFDAEKSLVILYEYKTDYQDDKGNPRRRVKKVRAIIDKEEAFEMSKKLNVRMTELPSLLQEKFREEDTFYPSDVEHLFKKVLEFVVDCGVHYRIER